jgi:hypothetical protein
VEILLPFETLFWISCESQIQNRAFCQVHWRSSVHSRTFSGPHWLTSSSAFSRNEPSGSSTDNTTLRGLSVSHMTAKNWLEKNSKSHFCPLLANDESSIVAKGEPLKVRRFFPPEFRLSRCLCAAQNYPCAVSSSAPGVFFSW